MQAQPLALLDDVPQDFAPDLSDNNNKVGDGQGAVDKPSLQVLVPLLCCSFLGVYMQIGT